MFRIGTVSMVWKATKHGYDPRANACLEQEQYP